MSTFGLTAYYADILRPYISDFGTVAILIAPIMVILFVRWGEMSDRVVSICHRLAASWFMILALGMEVGMFLGYSPPGSRFYHVLSHLGWMFAWAGIYREARKRASKNS